MIQVITLLAYGCPMQAIVQAFGLDERTVKKWHARAGAHCQAFHEHMVETSQLDLQQVQADEIKGRMKGHSVRMAMAIMVSTRRSAHNFQVVRRIVQGLPDQVSALIHNSQGGGVINTAYIERLNATFRQRLASLSRRNRCPAQQEATLTAGMYIVGCFYNFCDHHRSLRLRLWITERRHRWVQRTPAMAAALTDHRWSPHELFHFKVPPPQWQPPKRRGGGF
ncbi:MAG: hypothetical protein H6642_11065 [Caldilineaceae bacterium]|nr:hypothetical protein [Caldilineaceae bacterium]